MECCPRVAESVLPRLFSILLFRYKEAFNSQPSCPLSVELEMATTTGQENHSVSWLEDTSREHIFTRAG